MTPLMSIDGKDASASVSADETGAAHSMYKVDASVRRCAGSAFCSRRAQLGFISDKQ
jgi:hypothetical protein